MQYKYSKSQNLLIKIFKSMSVAGSLQMNLGFKKINRKTDQTTSDCFVFSDIFPKVIVTLS